MTPGTVPGHLRSTRGHPELRRQCPGRLRRAQRATKRASHELLERSKMIPRELQESPWREESAQLERFDTEKITCPFLDSGCNDFLAIFGKLVMKIEWEKNLLILQGRDFFQAGDPHEVSYFTGRKPLFHVCSCCIFWDSARKKST